MLPDYVSYDAVGLAQLIRNKEVTPREVLESAIAQAEAANPALNAIVTPLYDHAESRIERHRVEGPLAYVPFLLKDVHHSLAGTPMSNGSEIQKGELSRANAELVTRYLAAGLVVIGKTNTPEFKLSPTTHPKAWGPTRNPWDLSRTPAGSSGGSAAAVAAGIVPMASGTDEGGSIRTPSSCCGVFGLKPSRGRNPVGPDFRWQLEGLSTSHVISRSVRDSAAALDATSGPELGSSDAAPGETGFLQGLAEPLRRLRVGISMDAEVFGRPVDEAYLDGLRLAGRLLEDLGHEVEEVRLPFDETEALKLNLICIAAHMSRFLFDLEEVYGPSRVRAEVETITRFAARVGRAIRMQDFMRTRFRILELSVEMAHFHQTYDVLVTSPLGRVPPLIEEAEPKPNDVRLAAFLASPVGGQLLRARGALDALIDKQVEAVGWRMMHRTSLANLTGQPAMSVPLHQTETNLPIGVHFLGKLGDERTLLQLAAQLEQAKPWGTRSPSLTT